MLKPSIHRRHLFGKRTHIGLMGPTLCGKTNVAKWLMLIYWRVYGVRSIVCDPNPEQFWPDCALVFRDREKFWAFVETQKGCAVFADEAGSSVARDGELTARFTRGRQKEHIIHVLGHHYTNLLPEQRDQLGTLFLFRQGPKAAASWAEEWADERLKLAAGLPKYEFIWAEKFGDKLTGQHAITYGRFPMFDSPSLVTIPLDAPPLRLRGMEPKRLGFGVA